MRVGGVRAAGDERDVVEREAREDDRARALVELVDHLLDGDDRPARAEHRLLLDAR